MNTSDKAKVLLRYGHSFQQILSDLNKVNEDGIGQHSHNTFGTVVITTPDTHLDIDLQNTAEALLILEQS